MQLVQVSGPQIVMLAILLQEYHYYSSQAVRQHHVSLYVADHLQKFGIVIYVHRCRFNLCLEKLLADYNSSMKFRATTIMS